MIEKGLEVVGEAVHALRNQPSCILGLLFGIIMALLTYVSLREERQEMHERQLLIIDRCFVGLQQKDLPPHEKESK